MQCCFSEDVLVAGIPWATADAWICGCRRRASNRLGLILQNSTIQRRSSPSLIFVSSQKSRGSFDFWLRDSRSRRFAVRHIASFPSVGWQVEQLVENRPGGQERRAGGGADQTPSLAHPFGSGVKGDESLAAAGRGQRVTMWSAFRERTPSPRSLWLGWQHIGNRVIKRRAPTHGAARPACCRATGGVTARLTHLPLLRPRRPAVRRANPSPPERTTMTAHAPSIHQTCLPTAPTRAPSPSVPNPIARPRHLSPATHLRGSKHRDSPGSAPAPCLSPCQPHHRQRPRPAPRKAPKSRRSTKFFR